MNAKNLTLLLVAAGATVAAAAIALRGGGSHAEAPAERQKLLPVLSEKRGDLAAVNDAAVIRVQRASGGYTLKRSGDQWTIEDRGGYPVQIEQVRRAMNALADAVTVEAKTADPTRYSRLGVEDFDAPDSQSTLVTVLDASGRELVKLVVGKEADSGGIQSSGQRYVRRAGEKQSWLANLKLDLHDSVTGWLAKEIVEVKQERVRAVEIRQPDGETLHVDRASPDVRDFTLHGVPEGKEPTYPTVANSLASGLQYVNLEDVVPAGDVDFSTGTGPIARFETFDGLVMTVTTKDQDGKSYAVFTASYEAPAAPTPEVGAEGETPPPDPALALRAEEVRREVETLNARLSRWAYVISSYNRSQYGKKLSELVKDKAPPAAIAAPEEGSDFEDGGDGEPMVIPGDLPKEIQDQIRAHQESLGNKTVIGPARKPAKDDVEDGEAPDEDPPVDYDPPPRDEPAPDTDEPRAR